MRQRAFFKGLNILILYPVLGFAGIFGNAQGSDNLNQDVLKARHLFIEQVEYLAAGKTDSSILMLKTAAELFEKHEFRSEYVDCFTEMAKAADNLSVEEKFEYAQKAVLAGQKYLSNSDISMAKANRQLAEAYSWVGNIDSALNYFKLAIPIFEKAEIWTDLAWSFSLIAINYFLIEDYERFRENLLHMESVTENHYEEFDSITKTELRVSVLDWKSIDYELRGDLIKAESFALESLSLSLKHLNRTSMQFLHLSDKYERAATLAVEKGDFDRALDYRLKRTQILESIEEGLADLPFAYAYTGNVYMAKENYRLAVQFNKKGLQLDKELGTNYQDLQINVHNVLGKCYLATGQLDSAQYHLNLALKVPYDFARHITYGRMGILYNLKNQPDQAVSMLQKAIQKEQEKEFLTGHMVIEWYNELAKAYAEKGDYETAHKMLQKAHIENSSDFQDTLDFLSNPDFESVLHPIYFLETLITKAQIFSLNNQNPSALSDAFETYLTAAQWADNLRKTYVLEGTQLNWNRKFKQIYEEAISVAYQLYGQENDPKYLAHAFDFFERSKNSVLLNALQSSEGRHSGGVPYSLIRKEKDLNLNIAFYEKSIRLAKKAKDSEKADLYQNYLTEARLELARLKEETEKNYPKYHELKFEKSQLTLEKIQSEMTDENTAFVEYFIGNEKAFALLIMQEGVHFIRISNPGEIAYSVREFNSELNNLTAFQRNVKQAYSDYGRASFELNERVFKPISKHLPASVNRLIIIPDGILSTVPFEVLTEKPTENTSNDFGKLPYLLKRFQIRYAYSAVLLYKNTERGFQLPKNDECLAFAPAYKGEANLDIAMRGSLRSVRNGAIPLENTKHEILAIADYFDGIFDFGSSANEAYFKAEASNFGMIHLAMHGEPDYESPDFAHFKFTNVVEDSLEDNLLHHYEIANMDLNAQLAVLSACETGTGKYRDGEGVFSLARSFMYAGVPSVVMSLWKVNDESTSELMPYFYRNLADDMTKGAALHKAKTDFLKETDLEFRHPYYWAGFVLLGNNEPLKSGDFESIFWMTGLLFLGVLGFLFFRNAALLSRTGRNSKT